MFKVLYLSIGLVLGNITLLYSFYDNKSIYLIITEKGIVKKDTLFVGIEVLYNTYNDLPSNTVVTTYNGFGRQRYLLNITSHVGVSINPFFAQENQFLKNIIFKYRFMEGYEKKVDSVFYKGSQFLLQYNLFSARFLTLYAAYAIVGNYEFSHIVKQGDEFYAKHTNLSKGGFMLGGEFHLKRNLYVSLEYHSFGSYLGDAVTMQGVAFGLIYKAPVYTKKSKQQNADGIGETWT